MVLDAEGRRKRPQAELGERELVREASILYRTIVFNGRYTPCNIASEFISSNSHDGRDGSWKTYSINV